MFLNNTKHEKILNDFNSKYFSFEELMKNVDDINLKDLKEINYLFHTIRFLINWQTWKFQNSCYKNLLLS